MVAVDVRVDLESQYQEIDGFGVNINPVSHWRDGKLAPVLDTLVDDLGASIFRLDPYGTTDWIDPMGDLGRSALNRINYEAAYRSPPFGEAWETARYLASKGATILLNVSGRVPNWMCDEQGRLTDIKAYCELLVSLVDWARHKEGLPVKLFGPFNETDLGLPEGPSAGPQIVAEATALLAAGLRDLGLGDVKLVVADQGRYNLDYIQAIAREPAARDAVGVVGMHCYSDIPLDSVGRFIQDLDLPWRYWLTEYGDLDQTGEKEWEVAVASTRRLLRGLQDGAQAALVWDAYDNYHRHDESWSIYGLLRTALGRYLPKKRYYAAKQIYRFVRAGARRVAVTTSYPGVTCLAFTHAEGITIVGLNEGQDHISLRLALEHADEASLGGRECSIWATTRELNCEMLYRFPLSRQLQLHVLPESIFTVTSCAP